MKSKLGCLADVPIPYWTTNHIKQLVYWWFVWYTSDGGPNYAKEPPLNYGFSLEITTSSKGYGDIIGTIYQSNKGWKHLKIAEQEYVAYGAVPSADAICRAINYVEGIQLYLS